MWEVLIQILIFQHWELIKMEQTFYDHLNNGEKYFCDRCNVAELTEYEYLNNRRDIEGSNEKFIYCELCRWFVTLQKWTDSKGNKHTRRTDREVKVWQK